MPSNYKREDFKSPLEYDVYRFLKTKQKNKYNIGYEKEKLDYILVKNYIPDFIVTFSDGRKVYIEAKGYLRGEDRAKLLATKDRHPDKDIRIVFSKDNRLNKKSRSRYSDWAKKHGIPYSVGSIPAEWLE
jgi:hypothetical protein